VPVVPSEPPAPHLSEPEPQVVESPPSLVDSPHAKESALPVIEQASGKLSDYVEPQPSVAKTPDMTSREIQEEPDSVQPRVESGFESINKGFGIHAIRVEEPEPMPVTIPTPEPAVAIPAPEPAPVVIQVPEQEVPPPLRPFPTLGSSPFWVQLWSLSILRRITRPGLA
jgi:hypothetical protein